MVQRWQLTLPKRQLDLKCENYWVIYAQLKVMKIVWIIFEETRSACMSGRPVCPESEAEVFKKSLFSF